ncbi:3-hydroxyacyl-CoA dehydrogenase NAD-binding domain-containing protein, partial [Sphingobium indicum]|uniref:3-hydroxyacyl-CoA dehydrogenase NAD-binding domain-containing protein n=1 Tax=Sphingobium indicum TaxID=332055 RepID=UPI001E4E5DFA
MNMTAMQRIGLVGGGAMGRGIAQLFAGAGHDVAIFDAQSGAADAARDFVGSMFARAADKEKMTREDATSALSRIIACQTIADMAQCDIVIEAIVEQMAAKQQLFRELEAVVADGAILATNTSSLIISEIAAGCRRPERVAGLHFFNPVPLMRVAEVIAAVRTAPDVLATLRAVVEGAGHRAVSALDQPGFLVNHAGRGLYTEGLAILEEQVAPHDVIDRVLREAAGFRMGPFELFDLTGLDVSGKVLESIFAQFQQDPRFRPSALLPPRIAAGLFGRKTGEGWYRYNDDAPAPASPAS